MDTHNRNGKHARRRCARRWIDNRHVRTSRRWRDPESQFPGDRFYVKTPEFRDVIARAARKSYEIRHASMLSSWGTTWEYHIFNDIMRVDRMAPGTGRRSGTWFASPETLRFGLYQLNAEQPPLLEGETTIFSYEELRERRRTWEIHMGLAPLGEPSSYPGVKRANTLIAEGGDPHIPLRMLGGKTAFEAAIERGREDLVLLYAATPRTGFDPGEILPAKSPLHLAVLSGNPEAVEKALATHGGLHEEVNHEGKRIPLFELAGILGHTRIERLLLWETKWDDPERLGAHGRARLEFFAAIDRRERMQQWAAHDPSGTETWFRRYLDRPRLPLCEELLEIVSEWGRIYGGLSPSGPVTGVRVQILRWAIHGRVKEFVEYAKASGSRFAPGALAAVEQVYNYRWPYGVVMGPVFGRMYGWLQIELEKPREMERLRRWEERRRKNPQEEQEREPSGIELTILGAPGSTDGPSQEKRLVISWPPDPWEQKEDGE